MTTAKPSAGQLADAIEAKLKDPCGEYIISALEGNIIIPALRAPSVRLVDRETALSLVDKIRSGSHDGWGYGRDECADFILALAELPPSEWIDQNYQIDRYGVALMMIREGCADPSRLARRILDEFGEGSKP